MEKIKWEKKLIAGLSGLCLAATALAISANTTAFAATSEQPLSPDNGYEVSVGLSAADPAYVGLERVPEGDYILAVTPWYPETVVNPQFVATLDGVTESLKINEYMYGAYIGDFKISETSTRFEITTALTQTTTISVALYEKITPEALPTDAEHPATLGLYDMYNYSYTFPGDSGYYTINPNPSVDTQLDVMLKQNPNDFYGETVYDANYPVYLVKDKLYYFGVTYFGSPEGDQTVDVHFTFKAWTPTPVTEDTAFYAPVTYATDETPATVKYLIPVDLDADNYVLRIMQGPEAVYTSNVLLHLVDSENNETTVPVINGGCNFTVTDTTRSIYFTSDSETTFVIGGLVSTAPSPSKEIPLGTETGVSLRAGESIECFVVNVTETGNYNITLSNIKSGDTALETSPIMVSASYDTAVIAQGETSGMFPIVLGYPSGDYPGQSTKDEVLYFTNNYTDTVTFDVKVVKSTDNYDVALDVATELTAQPESSVTYFVPHITSGGTYLMTLTDEAGNIVIYDYLDRVEPFVDKVLPQNLYSFGNIIPGEGQTIDFTFAFVVVNNAATAESFTVRFEKVDSIFLGEEETLTVLSGTYNYYLGKLETGKYQIKLSDIPEGALFTVSYNGVTIVSNSIDTGYFTVDVPAGQRDEISRISIRNINDEPVTFKITVTEVADGDMTLGTAQTVTLGYNDQSETYNINLKAGTYTVTWENVPADTNIYVTINGNYVEQKDNTATFTVEADGIVAVQFTYFYYGADYTMSFSFTATITAATAEA